MPEVAAINSSRCLICQNDTIFCKKPGSAPGTMSFLISHENVRILVLKVSYLGSYFRDQSSPYYSEVEQFWMDINTHCHKKFPGRSKSNATIFSKQKLYKLMSGSN